MKEQNYIEQLTGAIGHPIAENPGAVIENAAYADLGLDDWRFLIIDVDPDELEDAIKGMKAFKMRGLNLTIPHKIKVMQYLDEISESARIIGAVNTIINKDGHLIGENTDGKGFMMSLETSGIDPKGKNVVVLGAGGAARAICVELALAGANKITIVNRPKGKELGDELVDILKQNTAIPECGRVDWEGQYKVPEDTDILINATPVGLYPNVDDIPNVDLDTITSDMFVQDVIPNPTETALVREMKKRGIRSGTGAGMIINQAAINTELWTGKKPNKEVMMKALEDAISD